MGTEYAWSVVISALFGAGVGVLLGFSYPHVFVQRVRIHVTIGAIILLTPFTLYFAVEKSPLITQLFFFLPVAGVVWLYVATQIINNHVDHEATNKREDLWELREHARKEELLHELESKAKAREYKSRSDDLEDLNIDERIKRLKEENLR